MVEPRKKKGLGERQDGSPGTSSGKSRYKVIPGTSEEETTNRQPPRIRVVDQEERLTPEERKRRFAMNLDMLIGLIGLSRKEVADEIGIKHKLVLRLVSAGISRPDDRNVKNLTKIATYFVLPSVDDLWRAGLLQLVLPADGSGGFINKFRDRLLAERQRRVAEERRPHRDELALLSRALGFEGASPTLTGEYAAKIVVILDSPKADQFRQLIDDYFYLVAIPSR